MAMKVWNVGDVLTAQDLNTWAVPLAAFKSADLSRASNTTPANDPDLTLALAANTVYHVQVALMYACASVSVDMKAQFTVPTGATGEHVHWYWSGSTTFDGPANSADLWTQQRTLNIQTGGDMGYTAHGTIFTTSAGSLTLQWSQATSSATATVMRKGSSMIAQAIG